MKRSLCLLSAAAFAALLLTQCATPDPSRLEEKIAAQDKKMQDRVDRSLARSQAWDDRWRNYSARQDAKYDAWIDGAMR